MQIGALLGGASHTDADFIYQYAENLGIAFQIQDDILDCFGDETLVGKQPGGDIIQNKKTLLLIEALKRSEQQGDTRLLAEINAATFNNAEKVETVKSLFQEYSIKEFGLAQRDLYVQHAMEALQQITLEESQKEILRGLVQYLVVRTF
jgi:geranylgeranyl diphosphate synthase type II